MVIKDVRVFSLAKKQYNNVHVQLVIKRKVSLVFHSLQITQVSVSAKYSIWINIR